MINSIWHICADMLMQFMDCLCEKKEEMFTM